MSPLAAGLAGCVSRSVSGSGTGGCDSGPTTATGFGSGSGEGAGTDAIEEGPGVSEAEVAIFLGDVEGAALNRSSSSLLSKSFSKLAALLARLAVLARLGGVASSADISAAVSALPHAQTVSTVAVISQ